MHQRKPESIQCLSRVSCRMRGSSTDMSFSNEVGLTGKRTCNGKTSHIPMLSFIAFLPCLCLMLVCFPLTLSIVYSCSMSPLYAHTNTRRCMLFHACHPWVFYNDLHFDMNRFVYVFLDGLPFCLFSVVCRVFARSLARFYVSSLLQVMWSCHLKVRPYHTNARLT